MDVKSEGGIRNTRKGKIERRCGTNKKRGRGA